MTNFDAIIIGSGPAGVSASFPLLEKGLKVLMVDGGKLPSIPSPQGNFIDTRKLDEFQHHWMIGEDFHALKMLNANYPKLRIPSQAYVFSEFEELNKIKGNNFIAEGSLAVGGLSNAWGCGVSAYSSFELSSFPFSSLDIRQSYKNIMKRIGVSGGANDALSDYFDLDETHQQQAIEPDKLSAFLLRRYKLKMNSKFLANFRLARSRLAVLSKNFDSREGCNRCGNCMWGCQRNALYTSANELPVLQKFPNFFYNQGFIVQKVESERNIVSVFGKSLLENRNYVISAKKVMLGAGTLATTKIVLNSLKLFDYKVPILFSPTAIFLLWLPKYLGTPCSNELGVGQLAFTLDLEDKNNAYGSNITPNGIMFSEFLRKAPLTRRRGVSFFSSLLSSCLVGNVFLSSKYSSGGAHLSVDGSLNVEGFYTEECLSVMVKVSKILRRSYLGLGALLVPKSFTLGKPGGDLHYSGSIPMKSSPLVAQSNYLGEVQGLKGVHVIDGACLPYLSEKPHTLTIMANADRISRLIRI